MRGRMSDAGPPAAERDAGPPAAERDAGPPAAERARGHKPAPTISGRKLVLVFLGLLVAALAAYGVVRRQVFAARDADRAAEAARRARNDTGAPNTGD